MLKPKPMVEIGSYPILWHIMKIYHHFGFDDFVILCGYKSCVIKDFFLNYYTRHSDITVDMRDNSLKIHRNICEPWTVTLLETGLNTMTGSRIKKARKYVGDNPFMLTYGDGVSDVDISEVVKCHKSAGKFITMTAVQPSARWGNLAFDKDGNIVSFQEKPTGDNSWINGGFFVCQPEVFDFIPDGESVVWEKEPLGALLSAGQMNVYKHKGFWHPMDMLRDKEMLNRLWNEGKAPWKTWKD